MQACRIGELLEPFLGPPEVRRLAPDALELISTHIDILQRWNARMNLTAIRSPEQIVTRHFGESLFAARVLRHAGAFAVAPTLSDIGSGAGFPGIPIKLLVPEVRLTLIESHHKKATFLREVIRVLALGDAEVFGGRAETWGQTASVVTLRAVEKFESVLPVAAGLVAAEGTLCLLTAESQSETARAILGQAWNPPNRQRIPGSAGRIVWLVQKSRSSPSL